MIDFKKKLLQKYSGHYVFSSCAVQILYLENLRPTNFHEIMLSFFKIKVLDKLEFVLMDLYRCEDIFEMVSKYY